MIYSIHFWSNKGRKIEKKYLYCDQYHIKKEVWVYKGFVEIVNDISNWTHLT